MSCQLSEDLWRRAIAHAKELRQRLHCIPELGFHESQTAATIRAELDRLGIPHIDGVSDAPTATIAVLGDPSRPCVALRADIDALPITERTDAAYASEHAGHAHSCGHDGHSATLAGAAAVLSSLGDPLPVCVKCIWQPAEEHGGGAERLVKAGVLNGRVGPKVSVIFARHGWPELPVGTVATRPGAMMAATDQFSVTITGKGGHAASPHLGRDPIVAAAEAIMSLQQIASREIDPLASAVVTVGSIHGGTAVNIIPSSVRFDGTVRTLTSEVRRQAKEAVFRRVAGVAAASGCVSQVEWEDGYPPTVNDPLVADYVTRIAKASLGNDAFIPLDASSMSGEDFAYYLEQVPGCFIRLGLRPRDAADFPGLHTPQFNFNDDAIETGIRLLVNLAVGWADETARS
jgi:amidohydrolase